MTETSGEITRLLPDVVEGDGSALDRLVPRVYDRLRAIARNQLAREDAEHPLPPTALVHEAYVDLAAIDDLDWQDRTRFFAFAWQVVRRVLVDHAVARKVRARRLRPRASSPACR